MLIWQCPILKSARVISGSEKSTTNNRMELTAVIEALKYIEEGDECIVYSDSQLFTNPDKKFMVIIRNKTVFRFYASQRQRKNV